MINKKILLTIILGFAVGFVLTASTAGFSGIIALPGVAARFFSHTVRKSGLLSGVKPWAAIGGCGESSGSVSSDAQLKWIGKGISGTLIDAEAIFSRSVLADSAIYKDDKFDGNMRLNTTSLFLSLFYHPRVLDLKLSIPLMIKEGYGRSTGPLGDITMNISRKWGFEGNLRTSLDLAFPTGRFDIPDNTEKILHPDLQLGSGMFGAGVRVNYTIDRDWGIVSLGALYSGGFFALITDRYGYEASTQRIVSDHKKFQLSRSGWGSINDRGMINPDNFNIFCDVDLKTSALSHGLCLNFFIPFRNGRGDDWVTFPSELSSNQPSAALYFPTREAAQTYADTLRDQDGNNVYSHPMVATTYSTTSDPNNKKWVLVNHSWIDRKAFPGFSFQYSVEKADMALPLLFGAATRFEFDGGIKFAGFAAGMGLKFPVY